MSARILPKSAKDGTYLEITFMKYMYDQYCSRIIRVNAWNTLFDMFYHEIK